MGHNVKDMFRCFGTICFLLCCFHGSGQLKSKKPLSGIMSDLHRATTDTGRVYIFLQLANYYLERVPLSEHKIDSALSFIKAAGKITDIIDAPVLKQEVAHCLAKYYLTTGAVVRGKNIILDLVNYERDRGNRAAEIRWLIDLEDHITYNDHNGISKVQCLKRLISLYDPVRNRRERIETELKLGDCYSQQLKLDSAEYLLEKTIAVYKVSDPALLLSPYFTLSEANRYKGNLSKALLYALACVKAAAKVEHVRNIESVYGQLALVYQDLGFVASSIDWYRKSLDIRIQEHKEPYQIYRTAGFLLQQLVRQQNTIEAVAVLNRVSKETQPVSAFDSATLYQLKANYYNSVKRYELAEAYYLKMIQSGGIIGKDAEVSVIAFQDIAEFYLNRHQYDKSKTYLRSALEVNFTMTTPARVRDLELMLYTVDSATGDYVSALKHMRKYQNLNDSLFNVSKSRQIQELQIQYETEKVNQDNKLLEKEGKLHQQRLSHANLARNWILAALIAMFVFLAFLLHNTIIKQRTNRKLEFQQQEIHRKNVSLNHLINEKEWLIKEIHHRVKNNFHMVIGLLDTQSGYLKSEEALTALKESQRRIQAMAFIHQKLYQSTNLSSVEMSAYIHELVDYLQDSFDTGPKVIFRLEIEKISLNLSHALPLALILNEAITNSIKYGFPGKKDGAITISLRREDADRILLTIRDNGLGMPVNFNLQESQTMGMKLMEGLSEDIYGELKITNIQGTSISLSFPYDPSALTELTLNTRNLSTETVI
jgi:two-component system, sensor histidine kinase PdtaS